MSADPVPQIRQVLDSHARLAVDAMTIDPRADLYDAGMTSHISVTVMMALEDAFEIEFPDRMLNRHVFANVETIATAISEVQSSS